MSIDDENGSMGCLGVLLLYATIGAVVFGLSWLIVDNTQKISALEQRVEQLEQAVADET